MYSVGKIYIRTPPTPPPSDAQRPLHLQSLKLQLHGVQCTIPPHPLTLPSFQASRSGSPIVTMEDLPPLHSSGVPSRAASAQSSSPELNESHLYIRDFVRETRQRLNFTSVQLPILDDHQRSGLSDGEMILVPLSCSSLNALASMTRQLDTITTQLATIQAAIHTMPTWTALQGVLEPINAAVRDLSHRVTAPPPQAPAPTRLPVPLTSVTTRQVPAPTRPSFRPSGAPAPLLPRPKARAPPLSKGPLPSSFNPDIPRYDVATPSFYGDPRRMRTSSRTRGKRTRSERVDTPTPPPSLQDTSLLTAPSPSNRMPRSPLAALPRAKRIRAPSRPPKSRQPATVCLVPSHRSRSPRPKEDFTLPVPPPLSTNRRP